MRLRVSRLTTGLPRKARDTVGCETPARNAMSNEVGFSCMNRGVNFAAPSGSDHGRGRQGKATARARCCAQTMKSRRYKFKKSHTVAGQPQGSVSKAALGKSVSPNRATHLDAGQRNTRRFSGQVERGEQTATGIEATECQDRFGGVDEFEIARDQQGKRFAPLEQAAKAVQGRGGIAFLRRHRQLPVLVRHRQPGRHVREARSFARIPRSEEHTSELQSHSDLVCRLLLEKKKKKYKTST